MGLGSWINFFFNRFVGIFKLFISEVLSVAKQIAIAQLKDIATYAVTEMQSTNMSNEDKRKAAFQKIKNYAVEKGVNAKDSLINLTIELALQKIKF